MEFETGEEYHMRRNTENDLSASGIAMFQCAFWLMLAIAVTGCDAVNIDTLGHGGAVEPDRATVANPESYALIGERSLDVAADRGVLANDAGPANVVPASTTTKFGGTVELRQNGGFTYTAPDDFFGSDSFVYTVQLDGGTMTGTATLKVYPADATPVP